MCRRTMPDLQINIQHWAQRLFQEVVDSKAKPHPLAQILSPLCDISISVIGAPGEGFSTGVACPSLVTAGRIVSDDLCCV